MIEYIHGDLTELTPALAVVETAGVGYGLNISLNTYTAIQGKQEVKLYVHEVLVTGGRDDSFTLFGFATKQERELYRLLITVSGVGGNQARMILSSLSPRELCEIISTGNDKMLKTVEVVLNTAVRDVGFQKKPGILYRQGLLQTRDHQQAGKMLAGVFLVVCAGKKPVLYIIVYHRRGYFVVFPRRKAAARKIFYDLIHIKVDVGKPVVCQ